MKEDFCQVLPSILRLIPDFWGLSVSEESELDSWTILFPVSDICLVNACLWLVNTLNTQLWLVNAGLSATGMLVVWSNSFMLEAASAIKHNIC